MHLCGFKGQLTWADVGKYTVYIGRDICLDSFTGILQGHLLDRDIGLRGTMEARDPLPIRTCTIGSISKLPNFGQQLGDQRTLVA